MTAAACGSFGDEKTTSSPPQYFVDLLVLWRYLQQVCQRVALLCDLSFASGTASLLVNCAPDRRYRPASTPPAIGRRRPAGCYSGLDGGYGRCGSDRSGYRLECARGHRPTPLVALDRLGEGVPGRVVVKLESDNPGGSVKDRVALAVIEAAERDGHLRPGGTVVELTSGNMGAGLAVVCAVKGYRMIAVMSAGNSVERRRQLQALGAEVELVPQAPARRPARSPGRTWPWSRPAPRSWCASCTPSAPTSSATPTPCAPTS